MAGVDMKPFLRVMKENLQPLNVEKLKCILADSLVFTKPFLRVMKENLRPLDVEKLKYILADSFTENQLQKLQNGKEVTVMSKKEHFLMVN